MITSNKGIVTIDGKGADIVADWGVLTKAIYEKCSMVISSSST